MKAFDAAVRRFSAFARLPGAPPPKSPPPKSPPPKSPLRTAFGVAFFGRRGGMIGMTAAALLILAALGADALAPHPPDAQFRDAALVPPAWVDGGSMRFPLGADDVGRDMLSRLLHGARPTLAAGAAATALAMAAGVLLGTAAGFYRGWVDAVVMRVVDVLLAVPGLLLAIAVAAALGPGLFNVAPAVALAAAPHCIRLARTAAAREAGREYVVASRAAGAGDLRLMFRVILPNCLSPLIVQAGLVFSAAVMETAALGFLGLGAQPPTAEWGAMLSSSMQFMQNAPWVTVAPGLAILTTALAFSLASDALRDALDPRMRPTVHAGPTRDEAPMRPEPPIEAPMRDDERMKP